MAKSFYESRLTPDIEFSEDYGLLLKQAKSLLTMLDCANFERELLRNEVSNFNRETLTANNESLDSERAANEQLTNELDLLQEYSEPKNWVRSYDVDGQLLGNAALFKFGEKCQRAKWHKLNQQKNLLIK